MPKFIITVIVLLGVLFSHASAQDAGQEMGSADFVGILIYAEWSDDSEEVKQIYDRLKEEWHQQGIYFTMFDLSDEFTQIRTEEFAELMGLDEILEEHEADTGSFLIIDFSNREVAYHLEEYTREDIEEILEGKLE